MKKINVKIKLFFNYIIKVKKMKNNNWIYFLYKMVLLVFVWFGFYGFCIKKKIIKIVV